MHAPTDHLPRRGLKASALRPEARDQLAELRDQLAGALAQQNLEDRLRAVHAEYCQLGASLAHVDRARALRAERTELALELLRLAGHDPTAAGVVSAVLGVWDGEREFARYASAFLPPARSLS